MSMEKQSELSELSLILWVSAVVGCPLNEVALYNKGLHPLPAYWLSAPELWSPVCEWPEV